MKYITEKVRRLITDNSIPIYVGNVITFTVKGQRYIGEVSDIGKEKMMLIDVEVHGEKKRLYNCEVRYENIDSGTCMYAQR